MNTFSILKSITPRADELGQGHSGNDAAPMVNLNEIRKSLKLLERIPRTRPSTSLSDRFYGHHSWEVLERILLRGEDDDDDDPTSPAAVAPRPRPPIFDDTRLPAAA